MINQIKKTDNNLKNISYISFDRRQKLIIVFKEMLGNKNPKITGFSKLDVLGKLEISECEFM